MGVDAAIDATATAVSSSKTNARSQRVSPATITDRLEIGKNKAFADQRAKALRSPEYLNIEKLMKETKTFLSQPGCTDDHRRELTRFVRTLGAAKAELIRVYTTKHPLKKPVFVPKMYTAGIQTRLGELRREILIEPPKVTGAVNTGLPSRPRRVGFTTAPDPRLPGRAPPA